MFRNFIHPDEPSKNELVTTYDVQCLNTEQGLHWTRETKMPRFLTSTLYSQYRILKILNQVSVGTPKRVKIVDADPLQTPRSIMSARGKRAQIRDKIEKEQREKEEKAREEQIMREQKQTEALAAVAKLRKAADPTLPGQDEIEILKVSVGDTPSEDLREWYKHLKKAQEKQEKIYGPAPKRPTSASSGIVRPGSRLTRRRESQEKPDVITETPTLALESDRSTPMPSESDVKPEQESDLTASDPVVNRPRSGYICQIDESETKVGMLRENRTVQEEANEIEDDEEDSAASSPRLNEAIIHDSKAGSSQDTKSDKSAGKEKSKQKRRTKSKPDLFFKGVEDFDGFVKFLQNTPGLQMFDFWLQLDKCNFTDSEQDLKSSLIEIKDKYCSISSPHVLPNTFRTMNNLRHITSFTKPQVRELQNKVITPLVNYWVPKYLNEKKQKFSKVLSENVAYSNHHKVTKSAQVLSYPEPKTPSAIPLRPRTCLPSIDISADYENITGPLEVPEKRNRAKSAAVVAQNTAKENREPPPSSTRTKSAQPSRRDMESGFGTLTTSFVDDLEIFDDNGDQGDDLSENESISGYAPDSGLGFSAKSSRPTTGKVSSRMASSARKSGEIRFEDLSDEDTESLQSYGSSVRDFRNFIGSAKMETLLQTLKNEFNTSGGVFRNFLQNSSNKNWINCLAFWNDLQNYHSLFYKDCISTEDILRKAKAIFALYIVLTAPKSINCSSEVRRTVSGQITNPTEELFDSAEEFSLQKLREPWLKMLEVEDYEYKKVEQYSVKRPLDIDPEYLKFLNKQGVVKVHMDVEDQEEEIDEEKEREELYKKLEFEVPEEFRWWKFDDLLKNRIEFECYRRFIAENYGTTDLACWVDIEGFKRMSHEEEEIRDTKATEIKSKYLNKKYFFGPNSPATTKEQEMVLALAGGWGKQIVPERPPNVMITEVGHYTRARLERKWLAMFLATPAFATRQVSREKNGDATDDVIMQKKRKQLQLSKIMESKWVSSSKEVIQFRRALLNPVTSEQFKKYVRIVTKENYLENDIIFWQEVQKFKDLFQPHADDNLALAKVQMIVACFLESIIHPAVQVDLPPEQVQDILDKRKKPTAYMFREAQLTVFRVLYPHWTEFCRFRHKMKSANKIDSKLDKKSDRQKIRQKKAFQKGLDAAGGTGSSTSDGGQEGFAASNVMDDIIMSQGDNVTSWKYSAYIDALKKQHQTLLDEVSSRVSDLSDNSSIIGPMYPSENGVK